MKTWLKKGLLVWLVFALVVSTLPAFEPRAEETKGDVAPTPKTTAEAKPVELVEERTEIQAQFLPKMEKGKYSTFGEGNEAITFGFESAEGEKEKNGCDGRGSKRRRQ